MCNPRYQDIVALPRHVSPSRRRMTNLERAAQFAPFAALTGYDDAIQEEARLTEAEREIGEWERAELDEKMRVLEAGAASQPKITVTYFQPDGRKQGGAYVTVTGKLKKLRAWERELLLADGTVIPLDAVRGLEGELFSALGE
jgi:hypothetical protein